MSHLAAMAVAMLLLMPFAFNESLLTVHLLGINIRANLMEGIMQMAQQGEVITASMVAFCTLGAPAALIVAIACLYVGPFLGMNLRPVLLILDRLKEWVMLDIYLVGIAVASIKVQDYADIDPGPGLVAFISLTILSLITLIYLNIEQLWQHFYPQPAQQAEPETAASLP